MEGVAIIAFTVGIAVNATTIGRRRFCAARPERLLATCALWSSGWIAVAVVASFIAGGMAVVVADPIVVYFLHGKSVGIAAYVFYFAASFNAVAGAWYTAYWIATTRGRRGWQAVWVVFFVLLCVASFYRVFCIGAAGGDVR